MNMLFCHCLTRTSGNIAASAATEEGHEDDDEISLLTQSEDNNDVDQHHFQGQRQRANIASRPTSAPVETPTTSLAETDESIATANSEQQSGRSSFSRLPAKRSYRRPDNVDLSGAGELQQTLKDMVQVISERRSNKQVQEINEDEHFASSVGKRLARLTPRQNALAKIRIQPIQMDLEFGDEHEAAQSSGSCTRSSSVHPESIANDRQESFSELMSSAFSSVYRHDN